MSSIAYRAGLFCLCALAASGCFSVSHKLPPHAYFGTLPKAPAETVTRFERSAMKNWLAAGLIPWSRFSSDDLLAEGGAGVLRYENLQVKTEFNWVDTVAWVVPGQFYGYYVWAPRHIIVTGQEVRSGAPAP
jgi:hypothetical protein